MGRVVAPEDRLVTAVRIRDPEAVPVGEVAIDIIPSAVKDASVGHQ